MNSNPLKRRRLSNGGEYIYPAKKQRIAFYLDDYTPIRTVQVTSLEDYVCAGYLRAYFECKIGPVDNVTVDKLKLEESDQEMRVGYVTFVTPEDAARSIYDQSFQSKCKFSIEKADDDHQPKIDPNAVKFEELNDDCLMHIASFLNLIDKINLGKTSRRLRSFAEKELFPKRTQITFGATSTADLSINKKNLPTILEAMGKHFKSVQWIHLNGRQMDQFTQCCKNVTALKLVAPNLHSDSIERNRLLFENIEALEIENGDLYDPDISAMITASRNLKSLQLIGCCNIRGNFLSRWKDSSLIYLRMVRCQGLSSSKITDFQRQNKLLKFSSDTFDSFIACLTLPATVLYNYTELELTVNSSTDEKLDRLKFDELRQLQKIHLKCTFFNYRVDEDVTVAKNFNNIFVSLRPIDSLNSITVDFVIIDADTFKSLRELNLRNIYNAVGQEMYSSLCVHLPKLIKLSMSIANAAENVDVRSICDMVSGLVDLKYFSHSSMSWGLLNMIRNVRFDRNEPPIEIGISTSMFSSRIKKTFVEQSRGKLNLSFVK